MCAHSLMWLVTGTRVHCRGFLNGYTGALWGFLNGPAIYSWEGYEVSWRVGGPTPRQLRGEGVGSGNQSLNWDL